MSTPAQATHRATCSMVMGMAWAAKRADSTRTFSDCMKSAWAFVKRSAKAAARFMKAARFGIAHGRVVKVRDTCARPNVRAALDAGQTTKARMWGSAHWR